MTPPNMIIDDNPETVGLFDVDIAQLHQLQLGETIRCIGVDDTNPSRRFPVDVVVAGYTETLKILYVYEYMFAETNTLEESGRLEPMYVVFLLRKNNSDAGLLEEMLMEATPFEERLVDVG
jgi:hypothetical protein